MANTNKTPKAQEIKKAETKVSILDTIAAKLPQVAKASTPSIYKAELFDGQDEKGKKAHFRTPAAALEYFESLGWELCNIGTSPKDEGFAHPYLTYWIFKRKVSKEQKDDVIKNALMK